MDSRLNAAHAGLDALRAQLIARHRFTRLDVTLEADPQAKRVTLRGEVLVDRLRAPALDRVRAAFPGDWDLCDALRVPQPDRWFRLDAARWLRGGPGPGAAETVEVRPCDGPLQDLGGVEESACVRGLDGTVGWVARVALRERCAAPMLAPPTSDDGDRVVAHARGLLGVPYLLGGCSTVAVDCSGLVQDAVRVGIGVLLPRHSGDQLALGSLPGPPPPGPGHLVFVWSGAEAPHHVGVCTDATVVHASLSRQRVVEDEKAALWGGAPRMAHVPLHRLLALGRRSAGAANLLAAGLRLGS